MNILITGSNGFIGKNLVTHLKETRNYEISEFTKKDNLADLEKKN